ncbi:DUF551 domain-containing protein [Klebsiella pneumoniae]|nr:DUF551 domain-containing protein [Klebsiella pneumoniae]MDW7500563.1 DUF551 domain-containing protein [Klebsiella pneumoniae]MEA4418855.1 DUF551 domain-containing protein [Klebsiella pneumoniae]OLL08963.1 hypothetical protein KLPP_22250 [Klebsiella pneumoniae subsp. pneumoniae]
MTKSTITREQLEEWVEQFDEDGGCDATDRQLEALIRQSLAAMDSEPVAWRRFQETPNDGGYWILYDYRPNCSGVEPLYRHAQLAPASPVCSCPSGDGSLRWPCPVHPGNYPAQSDCCPAQNSVNPAQGGNSLVIPDEMTSGQAYEIGYYYGDPVDVFARGANWMRQHIIDSTLAAAPQSPGSEPATVPGKWIPVSERMPETDGNYWGWWSESKRQGPVWFIKSELQAQFQSSEITHWMPLPAAPQEVK